MVIKKLFSVNQPVLVELPQGSFRYCATKWVRRNLPEAALHLITKMSDGIVDPRITYILKDLKVGERFGHGLWHKDGFGAEDEIHRLLTFNGKPTEGIDGTILSEGYVWEFSGDYEHRAVKTDTDCLRLLIRISQSKIPFRNRWER